MPATATEIATSRASFGERAGQWHADAIAPPDLIPVSVVTLCDRALEDARKATDDVRSTYSGTQPPPPWPASAEMLAAAKRVQAHRDAAKVILRRAPKATFKSPDKVRAAIVRDGDALYAATAQLWGALARAPVGPKAIAKSFLQRDGFIPGVPNWALVLGGWYFFGRGGKGGGSIRNTGRRTRLS